MSTLAPKYNMDVNPVYQVDCSFAASGKTVAQTKRRVRFRFGFSNAEALAEGLTGTACRGEEHEINLVWSLTSGKRSVTADGQEVHVSRGGRAETKFETSWTMNGNHTIKLVAHAAPPLRHVPGFRQFDLLLDGCSFFDMPKIYELGAKNAMRQQMVPTGAQRSFAEPPGTYNNYNLSEYKRHQYAEDRRVNDGVGDHRRVEYAPAPALKEPTSLRSPTTVVESAPEPQQDFMSEPIQVKDLFASPVAIMDAIHAPTTHDEFTPVAEVVQPCNSSAVHNEILSAYGPPPANPGLLALTNGEPTPAYPPSPNAQVPPNYATPNYSSPAPQYASAPQYARAPQYTEAPHYAAAPQYAPAPQFTPTPQHTEAPSVITPPSAKLTMKELMEAPVEDEPVSEMERALKNLVNIDDISQEIKTPEQKKIEEKREGKKSKNKSKPVPPIAPSWHLGIAPPLADVQANKPVREPTSKEIMRTHAFDPRAAQAGMMVIYGAPDISSPGFGVHAQMQQQQQQYYYAQQQYAQQQYMHQQEQHMYAAY